jgi:DHA1 family L-arabinose/isopropyl-beta-D-thiogalactopyranoside export protein-like MFS transporter
MRRLPSVNAGKLSSVPLVLRRPALLAIYILLVTAQFTTYSYIEPFVQKVAGQSAGVTTTVLLLFGGMGVLGSVMVSWWGLRHPRGFLLAAIAVLSLSLLLLVPASSHEASLYVMSSVWGIAMICFALAMQSQVLKLAADATDVGMSMFSGIFNIGIGGGALLGSQVSMHAGMENIGWIGGGLVALGLAWCVWAFMRWSAGFQAAAH